MTCLQSPATRSTPDRAGAAAPGPSGSGPRSSGAGRTVAALLAAVAILLLPVAPASGVGKTPGSSGDEVRLVSVQFDVDPDAPTGQAGPLSAAPSAAPARYAAVQLEHRGESRRLQPIAGVVQVSLSAGDAEAVAAEVDGLRVGSSAAGYGDSLADSLASPDLPRFARIDVGPFDPGVAIDIRFERPLGEDDYVLIQEAGGDAAVEVEALVGDGEVTGSVRRIVAPYQWNTGYRAEQGVDQWATVIPVPAPAGGEAVVGLRLRAAQAEVKVLVLEPASGSPLAGVEASTSSSGGAEGDEAGAEGSAGDGAEPEPDEAPTETPGRAQIEVSAAVTEAVAVGGVGCDAALTAAEDAGAATGAGAAESLGAGAATFCFEVINRGEIDVTEISITDPRAGLTDARLPQASGPEVLAPGERAVFYHHTTPVIGLGEVTTRAVAQAAGSTIGASAPAANVPPAEEQNEVPTALAAVEDRPAGQGTAEEEASGQVPVEDQPAGQGMAEEGASDPPDALAMTGVPTEPWILVGLATGLIFFGYTTLTAFRRPGFHRAGPGEVSGHDQLDALGFD